MYGPTAHEVWSGRVMWLRVSIKRTCSGVERYGTTWVAITYLIEIQTHALTRSSVIRASRISDRPIYESSSFSLTRPTD